MICRVTTDSKNHENVTSCVESHIDVAEVRHETDREVEYMLPMSQVHLFASKFPTSNNCEMLMLMFSRFIC